MFDFSKTKIRCSRIGDIMSPGKGKTPAEIYVDALAELERQETMYSGMQKKDGAMGVKRAAKIEELKESVRLLDAVKNLDPLSEGCKTYLSSLYAFEKYGKWSAFKDRGNKYTNKGKLAEAESILLYSFLEDKFFSKNLDKIENEFLCGTPDLYEGPSIYQANYICDIKSSWDAETFFENLGKPLKQTYWWQVQGYMAISGAKQADVSFCLVNTPEHLIVDEQRRLFERLGSTTEADPEYVLRAAELENNLTFDDMPPEDRRIKFNLDRDDQAIESIYKKVEKCREWLAEIEKMHLNIPEILVSLGESI